LGGARRRRDQRRSRRRARVHRPRADQPHMSYASVAGHRRMALDTNRNDAYARALAEVITPDTVVLDLGAGTGVHGLVAARLGARHVYLVEPEDVIALAEEIAAANGLADRVTAVQGRIEDV